MMYQNTVLGDAGVILVAAECLPLWSVLDLPSATFARPIA